MKNTLSLNDLVKKSNRWYKKLGVITPQGRSKGTIEYIVRRIFEALPAKSMNYLERNPNDAERSIRMTVNTIMQAGEGGKMNPYKAFIQQAHNQMRSGYQSSKEEIFRAFRTQRPSLYAKYNSYMYRKGYSSRNYWFDNVELRQEGVIMYTSCELPLLQVGKPDNRRVFYSCLEIAYNFSDEAIEEAIMY